MTLLQGSQGWDLALPFQEPNSLMPSIDKVEDNLIQLLSSRSQETCPRNPRSVPQCEMRGGLRLASQV